MKNIKDILNINESNDMLKLTGNDKYNFYAIADILDNITGQISDWMETNEKYEDSATAELAHSLSNLSGLLKGDWDEDVVFSKWKL